MKIWMEIRQTGISWEATAENEGLWSIMYDKLKLNIQKTKILASGPITS